MLLSQKKRYLCEVIDVLTNLVVVIFSQCMYQIITLYTLKLTQWYMSNYYDLNKDGRERSP